LAVFELGRVNTSSHPHGITYTSNPEIIETGYQPAKTNGRVVLVGMSRAGNNIWLFSLPLHFGKVFVRSHGGDSIPHEDIPRYARLARIGRIKLDDVLTDDFTLDEIELGMCKIREGTVGGRCLIALCG